MNNGSCEFESHLGHQRVVGAPALATFFIHTMQGDVLVQWKIPGDRLCNVAEL